MQTFFFRTGLTALGLLLYAFSFCQGQRITMDDSTGLKSFSVLSGDTVLVRFDSAYVMNKATFKIYEGAYNRVRKGDPTVKKLLNDYENLINLQDSMLRTKENYYQSLKANFDSLVRGSNAFLDKTGTNIEAIDQSLSRATTQIMGIQTLLDSALEKLKKEGRQRLAIAVKGFAVGVGVTSIIFLLTN